jgi:hypothetical protein
MLEIVAGIDDHRQVIRVHDTYKAKDQLGAPDASGKRDHEAALGAHLNRSSSGERIRAVPGVGGPDQARPRTSTAGIPSSACPMRSDAAPAISSAKSGSA